MAETISLTEVVNRLQSGETSAVYFDRSIGRLVALESTDEAREGFERLPSFTEHDEIELARQFVETVENAGNRQRLQLALCDVDPFDAFATAIFRCQIANEWYQFRDQRLLQLAKEWLESRNIPYSDDVNPAAD